MRGRGRRRSSSSTARSRPGGSSRRGGYRIQGTLAHRIKVVDQAPGEWVWKRLADVAAGDLVPMQLGTLVGGPRRVPLPVLDQAYYAGDRHLVVPDVVTPTWPSWSATSWATAACTRRASGCASPTTDLDVVERLRDPGQGTVRPEPTVTPQRGLPGGHPPVGAAGAVVAGCRVRQGRCPTPTTSARAGCRRSRRRSCESNDAAVYAAFLRGLFEADGTVLDGVPSFSTASRVVRRRRPDDCCSRSG